MRKRIIMISIAIALLVALTVGAIHLFGTYLPDKRKKEEQMEMVKEYYLNKLDLYRAENEKYADYEVDVAFLGDSLTDGCDVQRYYPEYTVANRGIGGETSFGLELRLDVSLYELKPKVAVILIGGNNLKCMLRNYERMLVDIKETLPDTEIVMCSLTAMGLDWGHKNEIAAYNNVVLKKLSEKHGCYFVDLFTPLFNLDTQEIYSEYTTDGAHLTHRGYEVLTSEVKKGIALAIDEWYRMNGN